MSLEAHIEDEPFSDAAHSDSDGVSDTMEHRTLFDADSDSNDDEEFVPHDMDDELAVLIEDAKEEIGEYNIDPVVLDNNEDGVNAVLADGSDDSDDEEFVPHDMDDELAGLIEDAKEEIGEYNIDPVVLDNNEDGVNAVLADGSDDSDDEEFVPHDMDDELAGLIEDAKEEPTNISTDIELEPIPAEPVDSSMISDEKIQEVIQYYGRKFNFRVLHLKELISMLEKQFNTFFSRAQRRLINDAHTELMPAIEKPPPKPKSKLKVDDDDDDDDDNSKEGERKQAKKAKSTLKPGIKPPPKNCSSWIMYMKNVRSEFKTNNPALSFSDLTKLIATSWKTMDKEEKQKWQQLASDDKIRYETELAKFKKDYPEIAALLVKEKKRKTPAPVEEVAPKRNYKRSARPLPEDIVDEEAEPMSVFERKRAQEEEANKDLTYLERVTNLIKSKKTKAESDLQMDELVGMIKYFLNAMREAYQKDVEANRKGQPAFHKYKMLNEVSKQIAKGKLQQDFLDYGLLSVFRDWLTPLPDGNLVSLIVRTEIYRMLNDLPVTEDYLVESDGLGRVLVYLKRLETAQNKVTIQKLIQKWSRPIMNISTSYKQIPQTTDIERLRLIKQRHQDVSQEPWYVKHMTQGKRTRIPVPSAFDYANNAPIETKASSLDSDDDDAGKGGDDEAMEVNTRRPAAQEPQLTKILRKKPSKNQKFAIQASTVRLTARNRL